LVLFGLFWPVFGQNVPQYGVIAVKDKSFAAGKKNIFEFFKIYYQTVDKILI